MRWLVKIVATGLGLGYAPVAPGTAGTLLGVGIYYLLYISGMHPAFYGLITIALFFIGVLVSFRAEKMFDKKDARRIVIDEYVSYPVTMFLIPFSVKAMIIGFFLNRIIDITKPFPAKRVQKLPGGWGVMVDDLFAGIYSNILLRIILLLLGKML